MKHDLSKKAASQWNLIRCLAFGERDWIVLCALFFALSSSRDFLSFAGITTMTAGIIMLGPVFGMLLWFCCKLVNKRTGFGMIKSLWVANAFCAPFIIGLSWIFFALCHETIEDFMRLASKI